MYKILSEILWGKSCRIVAVIYPTGTLAHRKDHITLSCMSALQIAEIFGFNTNHRSLVRPQL